MADLGPGPESGPALEPASGLVIVDKPGGITSHDVVARVRRLAGTRKVGHAGTLDPMATGVLVIGFNRATRLLGYLMLTEKVYEATIRLGACTTTDDADGGLVEVRSAAQLRADQIRESLATFVGAIDQVPSAVSAIKIDGKRAHQRVREGEAVELAARRVTVHSLHVREPLMLGSDLIDVAVTIRCSSGTYIRAIARDLGRLLGVGGHLVSLRRTAVGPFEVSKSATLEELADSFSFIDIASAARSSFPAYDLSAELAADVRVGRRLPLTLPLVSAVFAPDGEFLALYQSASTSGPNAESALARPLAVFVG